MFLLGTILWFLNQQVRGASPATLIYVNGVQETSFGTSNAYSIKMTTQ